MSISSEIALCLQNNGSTCRVHPIDLGPEFVPHGDLRSLYRLTGLNREAILKYVCEVLHHED